MYMKKIVSAAFVLFVTFVSAAQTSETEVREKIEESFAEISSSIDQKTALKFTDKTSKRMKRFKKFKKFKRFKRFGERHARMHKRLHRGRKVVQSTVYNITN